MAMTDRDKPAPVLPECRPELLGVRQIATGETDVQKAARHRDSLIPLLNQICDIMTAARCDGMTVNFNIGASDAFGRFSVSSLEISKKLA